VKVYLDLCAIQRPLDTPDQIRIALEAEAVLGLIDLIKNDRVELLSSEVLYYEGQQSPLPIRKEHTLAVLSLAKTTLRLSERDKTRSIEIITAGIKPLDALHLAVAESGEAEYFCTCDDKLLQFVKRSKDLSVKVINPVELIREIEK